MKVACIDHELRTRRKNNPGYIWRTVSVSLRFCDYRSENISIVNRFQLHLKEKEGKKKKKEVYSGKEK
jgi:hypothetical protein